MSFCPSVPHTTRHWNMHARHTASAHLSCRSASVRLSFASAFVKLDFSNAGCVRTDTQGSPSSGIRNRICEGCHHCKRHARQRCWQATWSQRAVVTRIVGRKDSEVGRHGAIRVVRGRLVDDRHALLVDAQPRGDVADGGHYVRQAVALAGRLLAAKRLFEQGREGTEPSLPCRRRSPHTQPQRHLHSAPHLADCGARGKWLRKAARAVNSACRSGHSTPSGLVSSTGQTHPTSSKDPGSSKNRTQAEKERSKLVEKSCKGEGRALGPTCCGEYHKAD